MLCNRIAAEMGNWISDHRGLLAELVLSGPITSIHSRIMSVLSEVKPFFFPVGTRGVPLTRRYLCTCIYSSSEALRQTGMPWIVGQVFSAYDWLLIPSGMTRSEWSGQCWRYQQPDSRVYYLKWSVLKVSTAQGIQSRNRWTWVWLAKNCWSEPPE
jgi:hypothetical protein